MLQLHGSPPGYLYNKISTTLPLINVTRRVFMPTPIPAADNLLLFADDPKDLTKISIVAVDSETRYSGHHLHGGAGKNLCQRRHQQL